VGGAAGGASPPRRVGLVALDLDGTLVLPDGSVSPAVAQAVAATARRAHVVLATGRSLHAALPAVAQLGLRAGWLVASNGTVLAAYDGADHRVEWTLTFDARPAVALVRAALPDAVYAVEEHGVGYRVTAPFPDGELDGPLEVTTLERLVADPVNRVVVRTPGRPTEDFLAAVAAAGLHEVNYAIGYTSWMDLIPPGVSKASALEEVRARLGVPAEQTLAVGDGRNDLEMLAWAAWGVAMGHAPQSVRDAADEVAPDVDADGAAVVLRAHLLGGAP